MTKDKIEALEAEIPFNDPHEFGWKRYKYNVTYTDGTKGKMTLFRGFDEELVRARGGMKDCGWPIPFKEIESMKAVKHRKK